MLKIMGYLLILVVVSGFGLLQYHDRSQTINFTAFMPDVFEFCGKTIISSDSEYTRLQSWFESNQENWHASVVSYLPMHMYSGNNLSVNLMGDFTVVNYNDGENWAQVTNTAITKNLTSTCN